MIVLGCSEIVTGLALGKLNEWFNAYKLAAFGTLIVELGIVLLLLNYFLNKLSLCYVIAVIFGCADCFFNGQICTICSTDYPGIVEIFSIFRFFMSFSFMIF